MAKMSKSYVKAKLAIIEKKVLTKSEIGTFARMLNSVYRCKDAERRAQVRELIEKLEEKNYSITEEQTEFGINWLNKFLFTAKGNLRNSKQVQEFMSHQSATFICHVVRNFDRFEFIGYHETSNSYYSHFAPIYRTISKDGKYFDYTARMWQTPEILDTGKGYTALERALNETI
jgi:hypothetical protein